MVRFSTIVMFAVVLAGCAVGSEPADGWSGSTDGGAGADPEGTAPTGPPASDFPAAPIIDGTAPASSATLFGGASGGGSGGPCLIEPQVGSLFPRNFLRPRFRFTAPSGHNLFEIRLKTPAQKNELVAYTTSTSWTLPAEIWDGMSANSVGTPITMTVRSAVYNATSGAVSGLAVGTTGTFTIAPAEAAGSIVYWVLPGGSTSVSQLKGFTMGDESVRDVLDTSKIAGSKCIGCHTSTPDGEFVATAISDNASDGWGAASLGLRGVKDPTTTPSFLSASAKSLLARKDQHGPSFSKAHWSAGDHVQLSHLVVGGKRQIVWTDLEATSTAEGTGWGVVARSGDTGAAGGAAWSHDGKSIVYFSAPAISAGVIDGAGQSDLFVVPYGDKKGGAAKKLFSDAAHASYYPQFSGDDALIAFNQVPRGETTYNNKKAELFVTPATGGTPTRLAANDPPSCLSGKSPGITNSWPKWSPHATVYGTKTYYWLTFSSTRGAGNPQIYVAPVVVSGGTIQTYPALYLWNQPAAEHNHTPAWDVFALGGIK